jgi:hypothetical protein
MKTKLTVQNWNSAVQLVLLALIASCGGCQSGYTYRGPIVDNNLPSASTTANTMPVPPSDPSTPPKHYADGEAIPGVGWAIGDVYILPDGGCYGGGDSSGIRWNSGARMMFGNTISRFSPLHLVQAGSPATK